MCLLVLPVASMCQLCTQTHTHTHTGSRMLSRCCSRRWRLESGVVRRSTPPTHAAAAAATTNTNVLRSAGLAANGCTKHNTQKSYRSLVLLLCCSSFCCFCCFIWHVNRQRYRCAVVLLLEFFEDFTYFILFLHLFTSRHPHTLRSKCMTRGTASERECEWERAREKERVWSQKHKQTAAAAEAAARNYKRKNKQIYL